MKPHRLLLWALLLALALFFLTPLYVMLTTSLKSMDAVRSGGLLSLPPSLDFSPWAKAWGAACTGSASASQQVSSSRFMPGSMRGSTGLAHGDLEHHRLGRQVQPVVDLVAVPDAV